MRSFLFGSLLWFSIPLCGFGAEPVKVEQIEIKDLGCELPVSMQLRKGINELAAPEHKKAAEKRAKELGLEGILENSNDDPFSMLQAQRASDGTVFLCDHGQMTFWIRRENQWHCLLCGLNVNKTFGGAPPGLPVIYLGKGMFAFSETVVDEIEQPKKEQFPQALAITFLLDSKAGKIVARSEAFAYDHNPPVKVPDEWYARYDLAPQKTNE